MTSSPLLSVRHLVKRFSLRRGLLRRPCAELHAVDDVSFDVDAGTTWGLVGESGCGKTTLARCVLRLLEPTSGEVLFDGRNIGALGPTARSALARDMQVIFQDPYGSLNPRMTAAEIVAEGLVIHGLARSAAAQARRVGELLELVGLSAEHACRFPHEFSGGQRQRIGIARALATQPRLIVCDEPVSALDVSVQAQIVNLLQDLQEELGVAYVFISHDLPIVRHVSHRVAVMYLGRIVESATTADLFSHPRHPYTRALLAALPSGEGGARRSPVVLEETPAAGAATNQGCSFFQRCPRAVTGLCDARLPPCRDVGPGHQVACHLA